MHIQLLGRDKCYGLEDPGHGKIAQVYQANQVAVAPVDDAAVANAIDLILRMLETGKQDISSLAVALRDTLPTDRINQVAPLIYTGLSQLLKASKIKLLPSRKIVENGTRPKIYFELL